MTKDEQDVSGDTFSMINLQSGELLMALSDGMGSGISALDGINIVMQGASERVRPIFITCNEPSGTIKEPLPLSPWLKNCNDK